MLTMSQARYQSATVEVMLCIANFRCGSRKLSALQKMVAALRICDVRRHDWLTAMDYLPQLSDGGASLRGVAKCNFMHSGDGRWIGGP